MTKKSDAPAIRFKGFSDAWEQRKLSDLIIEYKETVDSDCTLPVLTSSKTEGVVLQEEHFGRVQNHDITGYNILPRNYCTYRNRSDGVDFTFNINRCCDKGIISKFYPVFYGNNSDIFFISMVLNYCDEVVREIAYTCTGTGQKVLSFLDLQKMNIRVPSYDEQKKISQYFEQLDNLITLHQRKFEKLTNVKKSMLEKMFPQNGSSYPEIRFKGFTDPWEQRKLSHFLEVSSEKNTDNLYTKDDVLSVSGDFGVVNQIEFQGRSFAGASVSNYGVVHTGDVVYTKSPLKANPYGIIKANKGKTGIVSVLYGVYHTRENANADFVQMYFEQEARLNNYLRPLVNKGAKNTLLISDTDALEGEVCLAPTFDEQKVIGQFFDSLDNLITLHQRKCALLFSHFQALISMMFTTSTFSWEQRKAIDIADYSKGNGYSKGDLTDAGNPIILYGRLYTKYQFAISEVDTFAVPRNGAVYSQGNEVIVPASGETAEDIARASAVEKSGVLLGGDLNILRPFDFINPLFLALAISNGEPQKELAKKAQGKSVVHIHNTDIQEVTIAYPSKTEQDRIVSVFRQLDNLITLHQRKPFLMKWRTSDANRNQTNRLVL